jgi:hypothetical protein
MEQIRTRWSGSATSMHDSASTVRKSIGRSRNGRASVFVEFCRGEFAILEYVKNKAKRRRS